MSIQLFTPQKNKGCPLGSHPFNPPIPHDPMSDSDVVPKMFPHRLYHISEKENSLSNVTSVLVGLGPTPALHPPPQPNVRHYKGQGAFKQIRCFLSKDDQMPQVITSDSRTQSYRTLGNVVFMDLWLHSTLPACITDSFP